MTDQPDLFPDAFQDSPCDAAVKDVRLEISWHELFGRNMAAISPEIRRMRWDKWKGLDGASPGSWTNPEACLGCKHLDADWCGMMGLPIGYNPVTQIPGMACMGCGYDSGAGEESQYALALDGREGI